jgi:hypothetical protein
LRIGCAGATWRSGCKLISVGGRTTEAAVKLGTILPIAALCLAGCGDAGVVVISTATPVVNNFLLSWEIDSLGSGLVACETVGAVRVDMDLVNLNSGNRFVFSFDCRAFEGTSGPVDFGTFDVVLNLIDGNGALLSQQELTAQNMTIAGSVDLGHRIFQVP